MTKLVIQRPSWVCALPYLQTSDEEHFSCVQVLDRDLEAQQIIADQGNELRDLRLSIRAYEAAAVDKRRRESANFDPRCTEPCPNKDTGSKQRRRGVASSARGTG